MNDNAPTFQRVATFTKPENNYIKVAQADRKPHDTSDSSEGSVGIEEGLQVTPNEFSNLKKNNFDILKSASRNVSSVNYGLSPIGPNSNQSLGRTSILPPDQMENVLRPPSLIDSMTSNPSSVSISYFGNNSPTALPNQGRPSRRPSRFYTIDKKEAPSIPSILQDPRPTPPKLSKSHDFLELNLQAVDESDLDSKSSKRPRPSAINILRRQSSKRYSRDSTKMLSPGQISMIDDKVSIAHHDTKGGKVTLINSTDRAKARKSKLLDKISLIAARVPTGKDDDTPAAIFKQVLKKVNPNSLHKAEKNLKRRYFIRLKKKLTMFIKAPLQVFSPEDNFSLLWNIIVPIMVCLDTFYTPFRISFFTDDRYDSYLFISTIIPIFFLLDICVNFRTAFYEKGILITDSKTIFKHYLGQGFTADGIVVVTDLLALLYLDTPLWFFKIVSAVRIKKLWEIITRSQDLVIMSRVWHAILKMLKLWGGIILVAHWLACIFHMLAWQRRFLEHTWLHENQLTDAGIGDRYMTAFYWSITTMVTVGYGDVVPISNAERIYTVTAMIIASVLFGYSLNTVGDIIREMDYEKDQRREKMRSVRKYMNQKALGKNIQTRVKNYLQYMIESRMLYKHDDEEFFELLSQNLKEEIISEVNGKILAESKLFSINFTVKAASRLAQHMKEILLSPEEVVFEEGDDQDFSIYFIVYGKIQIDYRVKKVRVLEKGEIFGEISFFSGHARTARAKSLFFTNLYSLKREVTMEKLTGAPSDYETFHLMKDNVNLYKDYSHMQLDCYSCEEKGHIARDCPRVHYQPKRDEIIKDCLKKELLFRVNFNRNPREKHNARAHHKTINEAAKMIQEDYNDYTLSDEELSQDSLDIILERNLILLPGAEINDMKTRKLDRKRKSTRMSANLLYEQVMHLNNDLMGRRGSQLSANIPGAEPGTLDPLSVKTPSGDYIFFSIDKVENFELYYPQNNVIKLITEFEKQRFEKLLESRGGVAKALVIRNFGSMLRSNKGPHKSPLFYANLKKERIRGRKKNATENAMPFQRLKTLMEDAIRDKKKKKKMNKNTISPFSDWEDASSYKSDFANREREDSESSFDGIGQPTGIGRPPPPSPGIIENLDEATLTKLDRAYERRMTNPSLQMNKLASMTPKMMNKTSSDVQKGSSVGSSLDAGTPQRFNRDGSEDKDKDRRKRSNGKKLTTKQDEVKEILLDIMKPEAHRKLSNVPPSHRRTSRSLSQGKIDDIDKIIDRIDMVDLFAKMVERKLTKTATAHFGN